MILRHLRPEGAPWYTTAARRRFMLGILAFVPALLAGRVLAEILPERDANVLEGLLVATFALLFAWIALGFWTAVLGFVTLMRKNDPWAITQQASGPKCATAQAARTALIMPIYNEDVPRVFAGLRAIHESLHKTGRLAQFDFYILSDSDDPDKWVEEEIAWAALCQAVEGFGRIHYRIRRTRVKRKTGNIADFCRRWGSQYDYMVVLDADSLMTGSALVRLTELMNQNPGVGMIQTVPYIVNARSLLARVQQFAGHVYGPLFAAGLHFWQLGEAHYWGHNAIIRTISFMKYCGLPRLPGQAPFGGDILSHDFVEAALMRRAGYSIWLAYDLPGSFEETPPSLLDELKRDRRWSQGNLQHLRLLLTKGFHPAHRATLGSGIMAYLTAPVWLAFLILSTITAIKETATEPEYFGSTPSLFPNWPESHTLEAGLLFSATMTLLFLPKLLSLIILFKRRRQEGLPPEVGRTSASAVFESLLSMLLSPMRMLAHTQYILLAVLGRTTRWAPQVRSSHLQPWRGTLGDYGGVAVLGVLWGILVALFAPAFLWWMTPVLAGLILIPLVGELTSSERLGAWSKAQGLFLTLEETNPPPELESILSPPPASSRSGFERAIVDPFVNALHVWLLRSETGLKQRPWVHCERIAEKALCQGLAALTRRERLGLLSDSEALSEVHHRIWRQPKLSDDWVSSI